MSSTLNYRQKGGFNAHTKHPELAKQAGSKGGAASVANHPELKTSEHGKWLASHRDRTKTPVRIKFSYSTQCFQCGEKSDLELESFCSKNCRKKISRKGYLLSQNLSGRPSASMRDLEDQELNGKYKEDNR